MQSESASCVDEVVLKGFRPHIIDCQKFVVMKSVSSAELDWTSMLADQSFPSVKPLHIYAIYIYACIYFLPFSFFTRQTDRRI